MASATDALPALSLRFSAGGGLRLAAAPPSPAPPPGEARVRVRRAGVCSTDLQILQGYVPGFDAALGHEFVGDVVAYTPAGAGSVGPAAAAAADAAGAALAGARVAGEINCRGAGVPPCAHADPFFRRNHAPGRTVLGIIGRDGCLAEYVDLPAENLHRVPEGLSDREAAFAEPLAAALRVAEQRALPSGCSVAVVGDGKLGLLVAATLAKGGHAVTLLGRHPEKMALAAPCGVGRAVVVGAATAAELAGAFDAAVEASGSASGARLALAVCAPLGTVVIKSTCAVVGGGEGGGAAGDPSAAGSAKPPPPALVEWSEIGNDAVVNEKTLVGSRCGPIGAALDLLAADADVRALVNAMVEAEAPLAEGVAAVARAGRRGAMKVQVVTPYGLAHAI